MDHELAVDVLEHRRVAGGVRDHEVHVGRPARAQHHGLHAKVLLPEVGDGLGHGGEVVEDILWPGAQRDHLVAFSRLAVVRLDEGEFVDHQPLLVHPFGRANVVGRDDQAAVLRLPRDRVLAPPAVALHAPRQHPHVGVHVLAPVHGAADDDRAILGNVEGSRAGRYRRRGGGQSDRGN